MIRKNFSAFLQSISSRLRNIKDSSAYDWGILIGTLIIPATVGWIGYRYTDQQNVRDIENRNHEVMTSYLDNMTDLILKDKLGKGKPLETDGARTVARSITLNAARRLDKEGRGQLLKFLYEAKLVGNCDLSKVSAIATSIDRKKVCQEEVFTLETAQLDGAILGDSPMPPLTGIKLDSANLKGANLPGIVIPFASISNARFANANLNGANLTGVFVEENRAVNLNGTYLQNATLTKAILSGASMNSALLQCAKLNDAEMQGANLRDAKLTNADLHSAGLGFNKSGKEKTDLTGADLRGAILTDVDLSAVKLDEADLTGAIYNEGTTLPERRSFVQLNMRPESTRKNSLAERKKACDDFRLTAWPPKQDKAQSQL